MEGITPDLIACFLVLPQSIITKLNFYIRHFAKRSFHFTHNIVAIYNLYLRRRVVSELWRKSYEDCRQRLEQASEGKLSLGLGQDGQVAGSPERQWRTDALDEERVYSREKLDRF